MPVFSEAMSVSEHWCWKNTIKPKQPLRRLEIQSPIHVTCVFGLWEENHRNTERTCDPHREEHCQEFNPFTATVHNV